MRKAKCRKTCFKSASVALCLTVVFCTTSAAPAAPQYIAEPELDARSAERAGINTPPTPQQQDRARDLRSELSALSIRYDRHFGTTRTVWNRGGYLSEPLPGPNLVESAQQFVAQRLDLLGLTVPDIEEWRVQYDYVSPASGTTHVFLEQFVEQRPVLNALLQINVGRDGRVISINNSFIARSRSSIEPVPIQLTFDAAIRAASAALGASDGVRVDVVTPGDGLNHRPVVVAPGLSKEPIEGGLAWLPIRRGVIRPVWAFRLATPNGAHLFDVTVDAQDGKLWTREDANQHARYRVYEQPVESPDDTTPAPPADARTLAIDPENSLASPKGWHEDATAEYTIMRGNNVHAFEDADYDELPPSIEPDCGPNLVCDFPLDVSAPPQDFAAASVANLFYWVNLIHDVQYQYGFTEAAGNFQDDNFGRGGQGGDAITALTLVEFLAYGAQFLVRPDGERPVLSMRVNRLPGLIEPGTPDIDSSLDSLVIAHEYGHGIVERQVGGPLNVSCVDGPSNDQGPEEGWADWIGLWYTAEASDRGKDGRAIGTYLLGEPPSGPGLRAQLYSTDPAVNDLTYESITGQTDNYLIGSPWAQALWEVYWALVDEHGFSAEIHDAFGGSGNQRAMLYVNEGLKFTACLPDFLDALDAVIMAAQEHFSGEDVCLVWQAFAGFGLGDDATSEGGNSTTVTNGFFTPASCGSCNVAADADCDGIVNEMDNCTLEPNPDQRDTNGDGYGNLCDPDLNDDEAVNASDLGLMKSVFFTNDPDADLNGDGNVNAIDLGILKSFFFMPPGPSGVVAP